MNEANDPRVFFAAERTLLAWVRTGLTVIGIGFVVARFGLFLRLVVPHGNDAVGSSSSTFLGVSFVLLGSVGIAMGVVQFARFVRTLRPADMPAEYRVGWSVAFASLLAATGLLLALYLLVRSGAS